MVFKCQEDSFLKEFTSTVLACNEIKIDDCENYEVILENTILFPEGGGQPCDYGFLNDIPVKQVLRREDTAVHLINKPLNEGDTVHQKLNWERRFDHMQQHSGQHLITAIFDQKFNFQTVSWWLGEEVSHIELDTPTLSVEQIKEVEQTVNELVRESRKVSVTVYSKNSSEDDLKQARSARGLPADHKGDIRVINIEGIDSNMCCGTHVSNLSQLQVIKLLHTEKSKRKNNILLYFLVGNRVLNRLDTCIKREQKLTQLLKNNPSEHTELVEKLQQNVKILNKNIQSILKDLAIMEAKKLKNINPEPKYFSLHRKEAEADFMNIFIKELGKTNIFLFLSTGDEKLIGNIILYGDEKAVSELGQKVCEILEGKGVGKGNKFQAKVSKMVHRKKAEICIAEYFK